MRTRLIGSQTRQNRQVFGGLQLLIHGARSAMPTLTKTNSLLEQWLRSLLARAHPNAVVVALANKLARIAWAVLRQRVGF
jgi:transposase